MRAATALVDVSPITEHRDFRRLWLGTTASWLGSQLTVFAVTFYIWDRTRNPAVVGLTGLVTAVPLVVFALLGGAVADRADRRRVVTWATGGQLLVSGLMAAVAATSSPVWAMLLLVPAASALSALAGPARRTFVAVLLPTDRLAAGLALNQLSFQVAMLLGPAAAGALTAARGTTACFVVDALSFLAALLGLAGLPSVAGGPRQGVRGPGTVWQGVRLATGLPVLGGALLCDLCATVLAMPMALFPVINQEKFGGSPQTLGLLGSAVAVGGVIASMLSGSVSRSARPGRVLLACGAGWGTALALVGLVSPLPAVLALLAVAGAADTWAVISRGTVVQSSTPDAVRGRVAALEQIVGVAGPQVGGFRAGLVAAASGGSAAILSGGLACLAGVALLAVRLPELRAFAPVRGARTT